MSEEREKESELSPRFYQYLADLVDKFYPITMIYDCFRTDLYFIEEWGNIEGDRNFYYSFKAHNKTIQDFIHGRICHLTFIKSAIESKYAMYSMINGFPADLREVSFEEIPNDYLPQIGCFMDKEMMYANDFEFIDSLTKI